MLYKIGLLKFIYYGNGQVQDNNENCCSETALTRTRTISLYTNLALIPGALIGYDTYQFYDTPYFKAFVCINAQ